MSRLLSAAIALLLAAGGGHAKDAGFAGEWRWSRGPESLLLVLQQSGTRLTGRHTAVGGEGSRVDEVLDNQPPSIEGTLQGQIANVTFRSGYPDSDGHGRATLTLRGGLLYWQVVEAEGEEYFPQKATLSRRR